MDINKIDTIIIELITQFNDPILARLLIVNKYLNSIITTHFCKKLEPTHKALSFGGDTIDLQTLCYKYMEKIVNKPEKRLTYDYCDECEIFGKIGTEQQKICVNGCVIKCCEQNIIVPKLYHFGAVLLCGCKLTHYLKTHKGKSCLCGESIDNTKMKCKRCNSIPFRYSGVYNFSDTSSEDDSYDEYHPDHPYYSHLYNNYANSSDDSSYD
jgi:hypothetical protein